MTDTAVILAAGVGNRLKGVSGELPKPLIPLAGVPILIRVMLLAQEAGIRRFVIVTGYGADQIRNAVTEHPAITAEVSFVYNPEYATRGIGASALCSAEAVDGSFALLMADHLFEVDTLRRLLRMPIDANQCVLAIDRKIDEVFDLDDATKVNEQDGRIVDIGKNLPDYNAIDTGMFLCTPIFFDYLKARASLGDDGISDAVLAIAAEGRMLTFDILDAYWQDVDTPAMQDAALRHLNRLRDG
jgi:1L-myo-inositol 1-phosphate cytidylyltransferase